MVKMLLAITNHYFSMNLLENGQQVFLTLEVKKTRIKNIVCTNKHMNII